MNSLTPPVVMRRNEVAGEKLLGIPVAGQYNEVAGSGVLYLACIQSSGEGFAAQFLQQIHKEFSRRFALTIVDIYGSAK